MLSGASEFRLQSSTDLVPGNGTQELMAEKQRIGSLGSATVAKGRGGGGGFYPSACIAATYTRNAPSSKCVDKRCKQQPRPVGPDGSEQGGSRRDHLANGAEDGSKSKFF